MTRVFFSLSNLNRKVDLILECKLNEKNKRRKRKKVAEFIYLYSTPWDIVSIDVLLRRSVLIISEMSLAVFVAAAVMILLNWARVPCC